MFGTFEELKIEVQQERRDLGDSSQLMIEEDIYQVGI